MRLSLKTALTWNFVLLASLPILIAGFIATKYLTTSIEKEISDKNLLLANAYASELDRFLDNALHRLEHVARLLENDTIISPEKINAFLAFKVAGETDLEMIKVLNKDDLITYLAPFDQNINGLNMSRQSYVIMAKKLQSAYWSNIFISPQTGASTLALAVPFKGGMIIGQISLSAVHKTISSKDMTTAGDVAVLDRNGTTIAHPDQDLVAERANLSNQAHIAAGRLGKQGNFRYQIDGQDRIGSIALVPATKWVVAVSQPLAEIFKPVHDLRYLLYGGVVLALLMAVAMAMFSLQKMLSPLKKLALDTQEIAEGNYNFKNFSASYSEIDDLNANFNTMVKEINHRETSLRNSETRFRAIFEQAAIGIAHVSLEGHFLLANQQFGKILGYANEELIKFTFQEITHPDDLSADLNQIDKVLQGKSDTYSMEKRFSRKNGDFIWTNLTVSIIRDEFNKPDYFVKVIADITTRKEAEKKLEELYAYTEQLIQSANVMIIGLDINGKVTHFNPAAERITGYQRTEIEGQDWFSMTVPKAAYSKVYNEFIRLVKGGLPKHFENSIFTKNGQKRIITWTNSSVQQRGNKVGTISFGLDITENKLREQQIREYQSRLKALASQLTLAEERERRTLAADLHDNVGHSLALARMQLSNILESDSRLERNLLVMDISNILLAALQQTRNLIFELSSPSMNDIGLQAAISDWLEDQIERRHGLKTEFTYNIADAQIKNLGEDVQALLFRNLRELLTNVVKHARAKHVIVSLQIEAGNLQIVVADDGIGCDFDAAHTKPSSERGFGLFSIEERMNDLGGSLVFESEPGSGCRVLLSIPLGGKDQSP